jgi:hypothetical protein
MYLQILREFPDKKLHENPSSGSHTSGGHMFG